MPAAVGFFFPDGCPVEVALLLLGLALCLVLFTAVADARRR